jgi:hypothetical protein
VDKFLSLAGRILLAQVGARHLSIDGLRSGGTKSG